MSDASDVAEARFSRLTAFLRDDPDNLTLLAHAAQTAFEAGQPEDASAILDRYALKAPLPPALTNLQGVVAMARGRFDAARDVFVSLDRGGEGGAAVRFNLALAQTMLGDYSEALSLLDEASVDASPRGPSLKVQTLHFMGRFEEALACGLALKARYPNDSALTGALASAAMDAGAADLARDYAKAAGEHEDGLAALGMLELAEERPQAALALQDRALAKNGLSARAWVGRGLALLALGRHAEGAADIDRGAALFKRHLGSWLAAGWAHFSAGDRDLARARFQTTLDLDDAFAEAHGAMAVLDILDGRLADGERRTEVALRLDRRCLSGALAKSLLLTEAGDAASAERVRQLAMNMPIGLGGKTIAQSLPGLMAKPR